MFGFGNVEEKVEERIEFNRGSFGWFTTEESIKGALRTEKGVIFPLAHGVNLEVYKSLRGGTDYGSINVCGFIINVQYPLGKKGHFISFPQYARKGGFSYHALCVDKDFHKLVKDLIACVYEEVNEDENEGEE